MIKQAHIQAFAINLAIVDTLVKEKRYTFADRMAINYVLNAHGGDVSAVQTGLVNGYLNGEISKENALKSFVEYINQPN